jgi:hypothetical protein
MELVYDLTTYFPPLTYRMMALEFTIYNVNTNTVGVCRIMFERSNRGEFFNAVSVTTLPGQFLFMGHSNSTVMDWVTLVGHAAIGITSALFIVLYTISKLVKGDSALSFLDIHYIAPIVIATLCLISFWFQFSIVLDNPLIAVNLGTVKTVNLQHEADVFNSINRINSVIVTLLITYILYGHIVPRNGMRRIWSIVAVIMIYTVSIAVVITVRWPTIFASYRITCIFMIRLAMAGVGFDELEIIRDIGGFFLTILLIFYVFGIYWLIGLGIGTVIYSMKRTGGTITESTFVQTVKDTRVAQAVPKIFERVSGGEFEPKGTFNKENCGQLNQIALHPDIVAKSGIADDDEEFLASIEVLAGRALGEISELKEDMETRIRDARDKLDVARYNVRECFRYIRQSTSE